MGAAVAALACRRYFSFDTIIPLHYGTLPILDENPDKVVEAMESDKGKVKTMQAGEVFEA